MIGASVLKPSAVPTSNHRNAVDAMATSRPTSVATESGGSLHCWCRVGLISDLTACSSGILFRTEG